MYGNNLSIKSFDDDLWQALEKERVRQEQHIELIASENYASPRILEAQGSILTNKYATRPCSLRTNHNSDHEPKTRDQKSTFTNHHIGTST